MRCVLCAAPPPPPQTLFLSTFVCCAKKTNTPVDFFLLKFYMRKKISAFFSCVHSSNDKNDTNDEIGWSFTHNKNFSCPRFLRPGVVLLEFVSTRIHSFIHSSGALVALSNWCRHSQRNTRNTRTHGERE